MEKPQITTSFRAPWQSTRFSTSPGAPRQSPRFSTYHEGPIWQSPMFSIAPEGPSLTKSEVSNISRGPLAKSQHLPRDSLAKPENFKISRGTLWSSTSEAFQISCGTWPRGYKLENSLKLKIKRNDLLLADTCPQAANHCALF